MPGSGAAQLPQKRVSEGLSKWQFGHVTATADLFFLDWLKINKERRQSQPGYDPDFYGVDIYSDLELQDKGEILFDRKLGFIYEKRTISFVIQKRGQGKIRKRISRASKTSPLGRCHQPREDSLVSYNRYLEMRRLRGLLQILS